MKKIAHNAWRVRDLGGRLPNRYSWYDIRCWINNRWPNQGII